MKKIFALVLALLMVLSMAACGGNTATPAENNNEPEASAPEAEAPEAETPAKLVVGLDDQFPPMGFRDENNELVGFDIDLVKTVGDRLGMEVELTPIDWSTKELELNGGKVDVLWNGLTITDARKETMLMSPAYIKNAQVIVVGVDSGLSTLADLAGKVVGLQDGSSADEAYAECAAAGTESDLIKAAENITLFNDLKIGRIDAVVVDKVVADYYITENGEGKLMLMDEQLADEEYGIAFKQGNDELADTILSELAAMVEDGTAAEISQKWFGEDRMVFEYNK